MLGIPDLEIITILLHELERLFKFPKIVSSFVEGKVFNWSTMPFIEGLYSYASKNSYSYRRKLASSIDGRLFFAGEATNFNGHNSTIHGAMESSERVIRELKETL